jgi:elongation of very long chain fatty acids protein 4
MESYNQAVTLWESRVSAGTQPALPLTSGIFLVCINAFYLGFTFVLYRIMKARAEPLRCKPFKTILLAYNLTCVVLAGYVVFGIVYKMMHSGYRFVGNPLVIPGSSEDDGLAEYMSKVFWVFYAQKFWEFLDTWFFIMRKSFRQVTFLHVFHHCSINIVVGLILPFEFNGDMYLPILLNAFVHVLMYSHYLVSALGLSTPWKPYLTSMQLMQFVTIATQSAMGLSRGDACGAPYFAKILMVAYMGSMLVLFGNFFFRTYILKKPSASSAGVVKRPEPMQITKSMTGRATLDGTGSARIELPDRFASAKEIHYQVTPVGQPMPNLHISHEPSAGDCSFGFSGGAPNMSVSWTATMVITLLAEPAKPLTCCGQLYRAENAQDPSCCQSQDVDKKQQ